MPSERLSDVLCGVAGEYFVAAELSRLGHIATVTLRSTRGIDVVATNLDASRSVGLQIKTNRGSDASWLLNAKAETLVGDDLFYVFVNLNNGQMPTYRVVRSADVAAKVAQSDRNNHAKPRRDGKPRKVTTMRKFTDRSRRYVGGWDVLAL